ncbi:hypothetical protein L6164_003587 [Bauhinia variegata]|uniref:Uncharacterized protein n=1 Tax=Bauhinia variegata TaxID=167791 RepID=A0ACB9Q1R2_BAUVA|nr:hypothetical protein L6164_003587 [Bauhinia variegata]
MASTTTAEEVATEKSASDEEVSWDISSSSQSSSRVTSKLNPNAPEWDIAREGSSKRKRCLYLTFSNARPFSESEIADFFNSVFGEYGPCVESVHMIRHGRNCPSVEAKVIFRFMTVAVTVMAGREEAIYIVNDKALYCKWFKRKNY